MSSVTRFLRQIPLATTYYEALSSTGSNYFEFVPGSGNFVGNYPPGVMQELANLTVPSGSILRDMGKTIVADVSGVAGKQFFRQVQILVPSTYTSLLGGLTGTNFGVIGDLSTPSNFAPYFSVYVKSSVAGLGVNGGFKPIMGGQM